MRIERYSAADHRGLVAEWFTRWGIDPAAALSLNPPTGFVIDRAAAGWLFRTDAPQAFLGNVISDPDSGVDVRARALDGLLDALRDEARGLGYTAIAGTPSRPSLIARFREHGFALVEGAAFAIRRT